ncbi:MAG: zinc ribbon domain-containing protein [Verrucomicrobiota bacterium JB022]|nr:zinc ribbon domain-containing protein [Verrucomicrobiota bacterium JB022]
MPTYEYVCQTCDREYEVFQRMSEDAHTTCNCGRAEPVKRKIGTGAGIIFKGGGFYETDFKAKKGSSGTESKSSDSGSSAKKADNAPKSAD